MLLAKSYLAYYFWGRNTSRFGAIEEENGRFVKKFLFFCLQEFTSTGILGKGGIFVKVVQVRPKCGETLFVARRL